jgi:hypothetical protein
VSLKQKHVHTPTRICPHRWCRWLHAAIAVLGITFLIVLLTRGSGGASLGGASTFWLIVVVAAVAGYAVSRVVLGQSTGQLAKLDRLDRINGVVLVVRPVWAAIAAATDIVNVVIAGAVGAEALSGQVGPSQMSGVTQSVVLTGLLIALANQGFRDFAHRMATKPVKPKRATVPALATSGV